MEHPSENTILAFVEGRLVAAEAGRLDDHIDACEPCRLLVIAAARASLTPGSDAEEASPPPAFDDAAPLERGAQLDRYTIADVLGRGGMGIVYAAHDPTLDRKVALKVLRAEVTARVGADIASARLLREARIAARLSHPNVVTIYDVDSHGGQIFIAMEYVDGQPLSAWLEEGPHPTREILERFTQAGRGLVAAHGAGLVHRDFKPANVLLGKDGRVRVSDFGLAGWTGEDASGKATAEGAGTALTRTGALLGTPLYMSPEQHHGERAGPRADQFSFAVALYEALYRRSAFEGKTLDELAASKARGPAEPPGGGEVPEHVRRALLRALRPQQEERFPSMEALLQKLEADPARTRRRAAVAVLAGVLVAAGLVVPAWVVREQQRVCRGAEVKLSGVWDDARRAAVRDAFGASKEPFAAVALGQVERALDAQAAAWVAGHVDACEATRVRGEQAESVLALRMACLDLRAKELKALVDIFSEADSATVGRAVQAVNAMTPVRTCADVAALSGPLPPPDDPALRARIDTTRGQLARGKALYDAAKYPTARALADEVVAEAKAIAHQPLLADALDLLGKLQQSQGAHAEAEATFLASIRAAEAGRHDWQAANGLTSLVFLAGHPLGRPADAHRWAELAAGAIARLGGDAEFEAALAGNEATVYVEEGKLDLALDAASRAHSLEQRLHGDAHLHTAKVKTNLGAALVALGRYAEARGHYQSALATFEGMLGPDHPACATVLNNSVEVHVRLNDLPAARAAAERAFSIRERALGPEHPALATTLLNLAEVRMMERAFADARPRLMRVVAIYEKALGPTHPNLAEPLEKLGELHMDTGEPTAAIPLIERALSLRASGAEGPYKDASTRFLLARALVAAGSDRARAKKLAEEARATYAAGGEAWAAPRAEIVAWLSQR
ncbi:serine/threonine-protein kinase [Polyangium mundeleinium]|uniref:Serine/threonine-protein kinase n=1 Tax=Polyangium mundeleinium TaxID=2995306 RepID=A0ABT5EFU9_9BACT|nr:serine/threonine-protein kinase [Polyangium mundeleinium]MDC0740704.1 serine/threonine-protein kinase [Polyangium mundeleinium]